MLGISAPPFLKGLLKTLKVVKWKSWTLSNRLRFQIQIEDLRLKCGIHQGNFKNKSTGSNLRKSNPNIPPKDIRVGHEFMVTSLKTR